MANNNDRVIRLTPTPFEDMPASYKDAVAYAAKNLAYDIDCQTLIAMASLLGHYQPEKTSPTDDNKQSSENGTGTA